MNALELIRKRKADWQQKKMDFESQIASDNRTGTRNLALLKEYDEFKKTCPITESRRKRLYMLHGKPVLDEYIAPYRAALEEAKSNFINAFAAYKAAAAKAHNASKQWGGGWFPEANEESESVDLTKIADIPSPAVPDPALCDDVQVDENEGGIEYEQIIF